MNIDPATQAYLREYHRLNPWVFHAFEKAALLMRRSGRRHYGAKAIMEKVRYDHDMENPDQEGFKINNNVTAYYARKAEERNPELKGFFEYRTIKGLKSVQIVTTSRNPIEQINL